MAKNMLEKLKEYCKEEREAGYVCRDEYVSKLIQLPANQWTEEYTAAEIAVAARLLREFSF